MLMKSLLRHPGRPRCRLADNIKLDMKIRWDGTEWIDLAQDSDW
jgi:hypothetical protein